MIFLDHVNFSTGRLKHWLRTSTTRIINCPQHCTLTTLRCACWLYRFSTPKANPNVVLKPFGGAVTSPEGYLLALWVHECRRVFADKLVNYDDKGWVDKAISDLCRQEFPPELCKQVCWQQKPSVRSWRQQLFMCACLTPTKCDKLCGSQSCRHVPHWCQTQQQSCPVLSCPCSGGRAPLLCRLPPGACCG